MSINTSLIPLLGTGGKAPEKYWVFHAGTSDSATNDNEAEDQIRFRAMALNPETETVYMGCHGWKFYNPTGAKNQAFFGFGLSKDGVVLSGTSQPNLKHNVGHSQLNPTGWGNYVKNFGSSHIQMRILANSRYMTTQPIAGGLLGANTSGGKVSRGYIAATGHYDASGAYMEASQYDMDNNQNYNNNWRRITNIRYYDASSNLNEFVVSSYSSQPIAMYQHTDGTFYMLWAGQISTGGYVFQIVRAYNVSGTLLWTAKVGADGNNSWPYNFQAGCLNPNNGNIIYPNTVQVSQQGYNGFFYELDKSDGSIAHNHNGDDVKINFRVGDINDAFGVNEYYMKCIKIDSDGKYYALFVSRRQQGNDSWTMSSDAEKSFYTTLVKLTRLTSGQGLNGTGFTIDWVRCFIGSTGGSSLMDTSVGWDKEKPVQIEVDDNAVYVGFGIRRADYKWNNYIIRMPKDGTGTGTYTAGDNTHKIHIRDVGPNSSEHADNKVSISRTDLSSGINHDTGTSDNEWGHLRGNYYGGQTTNEQNSYTYRNVGGYGQTGENKSIPTSSKVDIST